MRTPIFKIATLATLSGLVATPAFAASDSESWDKEFHFERGVVPKLYVRNVWGEVTVTTHRGNSIQLSVRQTRKARSQEALEELDRYLRLETVETEDGVEITLEDTDSDRRWWDRCRGCEFHADLEIRVPAEADVDVGTVMDGTVSVSDVRGQVHARNVNGDVELQGIHQCGEFETVNGELTVSFAELPVGVCQFETVNGDMVVRLPDDGGADVLSGSVQRRRTQ